MFCVLGSRQESFSRYFVRLLTCFLRVVFFVPTVPYFLYYYSFLRSLIRLGVAFFFGENSILIFQPDQRKASAHRKRRDLLQYLYAREKILR